MHDTMRDVMLAMSQGSKISDPAQGTLQSFGEQMSEEELIARTKEQLKEEASAAKLSSNGTSSNLHPALEPVPDDDWVGETWGLFWPDLEEFDELKENPEKFLKKHYEDKSKLPWHPPANLKAEISSIEALTAPKAEKPVVVPPVKAAVPEVILRPKKEEPIKSPELIVEEPQPEVMIPAPSFDPMNKERDPSKWDWAKSKDKSAGRARFSLSIYW